MVYLQSRYSSADFFPFLHLTIVALFSFTEVKMSNIVVVCVPPLWALLCSFPRHAAIPLTTGSTEPLLLPALGNHARLQLCRVVRHPPWQQMCARLWRLPWRRLFVRFPHILSGLVITPPPRCGREHFCWEWNYKWYYCIRCCFTVSVMNVTPPETAATARTTPTAGRMLPGILEPVDWITSYLPDLISGSLFLMSPCNDLCWCRPSPSNASVIRLFQS